MIKAMNITEKSKEYAEGKAIDAISAAIEQAYADGYKDGYNEGLSSRDNFSSNEVEDGVEYADLGLPSGTKWAIDFLRDDKGKVKFLLYEEAVDSEEDVDVVLVDCRLGKSSMSSPISSTK